MTSLEKSIRIAHKEKQRRILSASIRKEVASNERVVCSVDRSVCHNNHRIGCTVCAKTFVDLE